MAWKPEKTKIMKHHRHHVTVNLKQTSVSYTSKKNRLIGLVGRVFANGLGDQEPQIYFLSQINAPLNDSATNWPITRQSELIPSSFLELFFLVLFGCQPTTREQLASGPDRPLSHPLLRIPLGTPSLKNTLLLASHTLPTNSRTNILTGDTKRDTFSLLLFYSCYYN